MENFLQSVTNLREGEGLKRIMQEQLQFCKQMHERKTEDEKQWQSSRQSALKLLYFLDAWSLTWFVCHLFDTSLVTWR